MRFGESLLVLINGILLIHAVLRKPVITPVVLRTLAGIGAMITLGHLIFEGYRWQMLPVYVLIGGVMLPLLGRSGERYRLPGKVATAGLVILAVGMLFLVILPVPKLPTPSGPYPIGTVTYAWTDASRTEKYGDSPGNPREIMVQIWYPAEQPSGTAPLRWLESVDIARAMGQRNRLPAFLLEQVRLIRTHTYADAPFIGGTDPYPVIIYIHGWAGFRNINQDQSQALASNGYVVVSADHAYGALISLFPDGRIAYNDPEALNGDGSAQGKDIASTLLVHTFADDVRFMLDQIELLNKEDPDKRFTGRLDLARVGIFGHSTGGGAAMQVCAEDKRCQAVLGMDTWIEPVDENVINDGLAQPLMLLNSESWQSGPNIESLRVFYENASAPAYWLDIQGTAHYDFVLVPTFSPIASILGFSGSLPTHDILSINEAYLVAFFNRHIKGESEPWLDSASPDFPAVQYERR